MPVNHPAPANLIPAGEDYIVRRIHDLERVGREMQAVNQLWAALQQA